MTDDDVPPVLMLGFAPDERAKERRCISAHECKVLADSYGFQQRDVDFDGDMTPILQKLVADIRRDEFESAGDSAATPLVDMIVFGDVFVGKTSLVNRLLSGEFESKYVSSVPSRPRKVKVIVDDVLTILRLRDTPGTMYQSIITPDFMNVIHSAVIVYDITSRATFEAAQYIRRLVLAAKHEKRISVVLFGNKNEEQVLVQRQVAYEEGLALARSWRCPFFEVSCKTSNVDHIFKEAIREYRLTFNYDIVSSPKLNWSGFLQFNNSTNAKFSKKWISVNAGRFYFSSKPDSSKVAKSIELNENVGVIEGNHDKGSLLILSVMGMSPHIQCLLPSYVERAALADALFAELAFQNVVQDILGEVVKSAITSVFDPLTDPNPCILAHGRLSSSTNPTYTANSVASSSATASTSTSAPSPTGSPSSPNPLSAISSTPFRRNK